jgi:hypothetical protein
MAPLDDNHVKYALPHPFQSSTPPHHSNSYSSDSSQTDWQSKYHEVADMLTETKNELDEFHTSSKELEEELERELQRTEKAQQDLKVKLERAESEREEWKVRKCIISSFPLAHHPICSPGSCLFRPITTPQRPPSSVNSINFVLSTRRSGFS